MLTDDDKKWIEGRIAESEERLAERLEKVETTLLTEFHKWASPIDMRQRSHAAALRAHDAEMEALSDRVKNLEGR
jgi:hypothetical protein